MTNLDFNLLQTLDVLLTEGSVARAAKRLQLSPSAMSRALARLRAVTGDPLLVRAGRGLVPTPRALVLREQVGQLVHAAEAMLRPVQMLDVAQLERRFTLRCREGFIENFGADLLARSYATAPKVRLSFVPKLDKDSSPLREGKVDLDIGVVGIETSPEIRSRSLFSDQFIGVVRSGHPLASGEISASRYAACQHIAISRRGLAKSKIDAALQTQGLERDILTIVASFSAALALARASDLVATVPERQTGCLRDGMLSFALPIVLPELRIAMQWHPRFDADPAHHWLRGLVLAVCQGAEE